MQPLEIYIAPVPFDDQSGTKIRPALLLARGSEVIKVYKITSQYASKSKNIQSFYYPIQDWESAGISKVSYVDIHQNYGIPIKNFVGQRPIGKLSSTDVVGLSRFIAQNKKALLSLQHSLPTHQEP